MKLNELSYMLWGDIAGSEGQNVVVKAYKGVSSVSSNSRNHLAISCQAISVHASFRHTETLLLDDGKTFLWEMTFPNMVMAWGPNGPNPKPKHATKRSVDAGIGCAPQVMFHGL